MYQGLFEIRGNKVFPSVHALMIEPYKSLWEKDQSEDKIEAVNLFTYIEFLCSPKKSNPYHLATEAARPSILKKAIWGDERYEHPLYSPFEIMGAIHAYKEELKKAVGYELYLTAINTAERLRSFLEGFDPDERTRAGGLVLKPADIVKAMNDVPDAIKKLKESRDSMLAELEEISKTRNQREIGYYER